MKAKRKRREHGDEDKQKPDNLVDEPFANLELVTLKNFLKVFEYDSFGDRACDKIEKEFRDVL
jgi:hypothetical protein